LARRLSGMAAPPAIPVPPIPPATAPPSGPDAPVPHHTRTVALLLLAGVAALVGWRWYSDRYGTRPTELRRDIAHRIDLNRATKSDLMQIPGVGPLLADRIVGHRDSHGPFARVEDLDAVHGIGGATLNKIRPWVSVSPTDPELPPQPEPDRLTRKPSSVNVAKKPDVAGGLVNVNTASIEELDALPGIGPILAQRITAERQKRPFARVEDLRRVSGIGPKKLEAIRPLVTVGD
jgi:competence protein ComEA